MSEEIEKMFEKSRKNLKKWLEKQDNKTKEEKIIEQFERNTKVILLLDYLIIDDDDEDKNLIKECLKKIFPKDVIYTHTLKEIQTKMELQNKIIDTFIED